MSTTLLAVDDSVTMRKVLEITFASEDYRVVTADSADAALKAARADKPQIVLVDVTLPEMDGYALCRALRQELPAAALVILSSKQGPYDAARGTASGADDFIDKPFDTQQVLDKVKKVSATKASQPVAAAPPAPPAPVAPAKPSVAETKVSSTLPGAGQAPAVPPAPARPPLASAPAVLRTTLQGGGAAPAPVAAGPRAPVAINTPAPSPFVPAAAKPAPTPAPAPVAPKAPAAAAAPVAAVVDAAMADKLGGLGLTPAQVEAVLALSREVVERVVWEVVPVLAETMIKEEIKRLTQ